MLVTLCVPLSRHGLGDPASAPSAWPAPLLLEDSAECLAPGWTQERGEETLQCGGREVNHWEVRDDSDLVPPRQS